jgi:hypothetical protein
MEEGRGENGSGVQVEEEVNLTPEQIRNFLASEELWQDVDGDKTSDSAWHFWLQPKYDQEQRRKWLAEHGARTNGQSTDKCPVRP